MESVIVRTVEELEEAKKQDIKDITVQGDLAIKLHRAIKITTIGATGLVSLITIVGIGALTSRNSGDLSNLSNFALSSVELKGVDIALIIMASSMGIGLLFAISKGYDIDYSAGPPPTMKLRKK